MRTYLEFKEDNGYPSDDNLSYECKRCHGTVPSRTKHDIQCLCGGIQIKTKTYEVVAIKNIVKLFRETQT